MTHPDHDGPSAAHDHDHAHDHAQGSPAYFDEAAKTWDDDPDKRERAQQVAAAIRQVLPLERTWTAMEYGAGTGLLARALVDDLGEITLADASAGMTEAAAEVIAREGLSSMRAVRLDLTNDPAPADRYDLILALLALHHVDDIPRLLAAFHEVLASGGRVALCDLDSDDGYFHDATFTGHNGFARPALQAQLESAGFEGVAFCTAYTIGKEVDGQRREFPLFLATASRAERS